MEGAFVGGVSEWSCLLDGPVEVVAVEEEEDALVEVCGGEEAWPVAPTRRTNAISAASVDTSLVIAASAPGAALEGPAGQGRVRPDVAALRHGRAPAPAIVGTAAAPAPDLLGALAPVPSLRCSSYERASHRLLPDASCLHSSTLLLLE
ncbi:uncharacterized protein LOC108671989 isoform X2 [Hyalella azteca]|uniref:Uncharacterized protein LOC108671989 isoform X2 n=1 Tax=Hyalella azteca TaxID=294128 RepID=A0A8B7NPP7_HYAAZ|nr:uncharacterized protein LOC108671989 isoform X2 [Hyalella azteca]